MNQEQKQKLIDAAQLLRIEGQFYYDTWKRSLDATGSVAVQGRIAYDKYQILNSTAGEIERTLEEVIK